MRGTYEAERFLLEALVSRPPLRQMFINAFSQQRSKEFAERIVREEDLPSLHRAISWLALDLYGTPNKYQRHANSIGLAVELVNELVSPILEYQKAAG
ncbi:MAG TPA: hypothetical protein VMT22_12515 [Terriglobales bacterium]|nr:hypothetical protein [Terriglobales bacterium]